jgi:hypothetical protein
MNQTIKKVISVSLLVIFLLGSGAGQLVHSIFHKHPVFASPQTSLVLSTPHSYCNALQLILPDFSESAISGIPGTIVAVNNLFAQIEISISYSYSFKTSDRAPPVLA